MQHLFYRKTFRCAFPLSILAATSLLHKIILFSSLHYSMTVLISGKIP
ncbi:hypothetical protein ENTCAN_07371 [Enterobacter cancerogenus ATCC 35316]|nr:hypothetical protein ENTCAN_07371 [Enterobacter cancerogenus ATCC 35316]